MSANPTGVKGRKGSHGARRRARELALQGLYQWLLSAEDPAVIQVHLEDQDDFKACDPQHLQMLLQGCVREAAQLDEVLKRHIDRKSEELSPVEHAAMMIGCYELLHCIDIPYKVVINEAVELTKSFGGTDGHKYVNGVLDKAAAEVRAHEVRAARQA